MAIYGLKVDIFKEIAILRHFGFWKKCQKVDPLYVSMLKGRQLSDIFSKNPSKGLKTAILHLKSTKG